MRIHPLYFQPIPLQTPNGIDRKETIFPSIDCTSSITRNTHRDALQKLFWGNLITSRDWRCVCSYAMPRWRLNTKPGWALLYRLPPPPCLASRSEVSLTSVISHRTHVHSTGP
ncbi:hypothetical protein CDAR_533571 [Caerostris darwini]|uniref:Uncharacterized protein n=1 Tax=Caerostris darwini TaxID=1538125 RepID=A0AAV4S5I5_9ARAC|nr:hypothetical protein CDAR_533571 [Caerostris darwini]